MITPFVELLPIEKLDAVLYYVCHYERSFDEIKVQLHLPDNLASTNNLQMVLDKIVEDGYATKKVDQYQTTFNGEYFKFNGSYKGDFERKNHLLILQKKNQKNILWLTIILAFGAMIPACYYGLLIWDRYHS